MEKAETQVYELGYLILPSIPESELLGVVDNLKAAVTKAGGEIFDGEDPFKYELAYTITKNIGANRYVVNDAYIGWFKFELSPEFVSGVKDAIEKMNEVLRFILIKAPRETTFTFAKAKAALAAKEAQERGEEALAEEPSESAVVPEVVE